MNKKTNLPKTTYKERHSLHFIRKTYKYYAFINFSSDVNILANTSIIICGYFGLFLFNDTNEFFF